MSIQKLICITLLCGAAAQILARESYTDAQIAEDNARVELIVRSIQRNGPAELRQLDSSVIRDAARAFVFGERSGVINSAQIARQGGTEQAVRNSLMGQIRLLGR